MSLPSISVIIPVKNGASTLEACLQSIRSQTLGVQEILVLDSGSTDASVQIAKDFGARVEHVEQGSFNHGLTRNLGVSLVTGQLLFFTVQDARLADTNMLEKMADHFQDEDVMAAVGHQAVPHEMDKNPVLWFRRYTEPVVTVRQFSPAAFQALNQEEKKKVVAWDNVVAMYRRQALISQPFEETQFAEDWIWSYQAMEKGWKLIYDPSIVVFHYHFQSFNYCFRVNYSLNYHLYRFSFFTPSLPPVLKKTITGWVNLARHAQLSPGKKIFWMYHNFLANTSEWLSVVCFKTLLLFGAGGIAKGYHWFCKGIPQGMQKTKLVAHDKIEKFNSFE